MGTSTEPESKPATSEPARQFGSDRAYLIAGNDDYQQMVAEAAFIEAQQRARELGRSESERHRS